MTDAPTPGDAVRVERDGFVTTITIMRAGAHNALDYSTQLQLSAGFDAFAADDEQRVAILTGDGMKAFCAGLDLKEQAAEGGLKAPPTGFGGLTARTELFKPVIAAVNGYAFGGGFELALACDLIVASVNAVFALPEPRVGLAALGGGIQRLPRDIGLKRAMGLLLTGRRISAGEAMTLGIVNEVADDVLAAARRWADEIAMCSPLALRATKEAALRSLDEPIGDAMAAQWDYPGMRRMLDSEDAVEGPRAFSERRTPNWRAC